MKTIQVTHPLDLDLSKIRTLLIEKVKLAGLRDIIFLNKIGLVSKEDEVVFYGRVIKSECGVNLVAKFLKETATIIIAVFSGNEMYTRHLVEGDLAYNEALDLINNVKPVKNESKIN